MANLERSQRKAIKLMAGVPDNSELQIANVDDHETWLGFGWLVGRGWITYRGDWCFAWEKGGKGSALDYIDTD